LAASSLSGIILIPSDFPLGAEENRFFEISQAFRVTHASHIASTSEAGVKREIYRHFIADQYGRRKKTTRGGGLTL